MKIKTKLTSLTLFSILASSTFAAGGEFPIEPKQMSWPFEGPFGTFDRQAIQRGFQVYKEVCSACHGIPKVAFRNLREIGFSQAEVEAIASSYNIVDGPNDDGEMFERPGVPADHFPSPFPNEKAARSANGGLFPPDLSLIIKAREDGANYLYSLLTGYEDPPESMNVPEGTYYNPYFPTGVIGMAPPLASEGQVSYSDGTDATIQQMARDLVEFLQWTAEPEMEARKSMGIQTILYLLAFTVLFYAVYKKTWKDVE